jgi:hypothetical protein
VLIEAEIRRVDCRGCQQVRTEWMPWARPGARHTRDFEDLAGWLVKRMSKAGVAALLRTTWHTIDDLVRRLVGEHLDDDRLDGLYRIGVDEIAYRKGRKFLTVVTDHDTGRVVHLAEGRTSEALAALYQQLGPQRRDLIEAVSMDMTRIYREPTLAYLPQAAICYDPFVRHEALRDRVEVKGDSTAGQSQLVGEAGDSLTRGTPGRAGAVLTKPGRSGTARWAGSGERRGKVYARNRCRKSRKRGSGSNLVDVGRYAARDRRGLGWAVVNSEAGMNGPVGRPVGRSAAYRWRCCRDRVGHLLRESVCSERGNHPRSPSGPAAGRVDRAGPSPTDGRGWDGGPAVVVGVTPHRGGRESRPQGQGGQQVGSKDTECQEVVAGEYRRTGTSAVAGRATGTGDPDQAAPLGS